VDRAVVHAGLDRCAHHAVLVDPALALELGRADDRPEMVAGPRLVEDLHLGAGQGHNDHALDLSEIGHGA
jgi:hypothetical protein